MKKIISLLLASGLVFLLSGPLGAAELDLSRYRGQAVYLDFWASWCVPCKKSFPWMEQMQKKYGEQGLQVIAVNLDEEPGDADDFLKKYPVSFTIVRDPKGELAERFKVQGMPTAVIFDANGKQVERHIGFRADEIKDYEAAIVSALPKSGEKAQ